MTKHPKRTCICGHNREDHIKEINRCDCGDCETYETWICTAWKCKCEWFYPQEWRDKARERLGK